MANMSYCRFENTSKDLADVVENWDSLDEESSNYEKSARVQIIKLAIELLEMEGYEITASNE